MDGFGVAPGIAFLDVFAGWDIYQLSTVAKTHQHAFVFRGYAVFVGQETATRLKCVYLLVFDQAAHLAWQQLRRRHLTPCAHFWLLFL